MRGGGGIAILAGSDAAAFEECLGLGCGLQARAGTVDGGCLVPSHTPLYTPPN